jgi:FtsP/CotA-like multicopper oxidase with cupredoxin domain
MDIYESEIRVFDNAVPKCKNRPPTKFLTYNGLVPGPTVISPSGHESLIRFNNKIKNLPFKSPLNDTSKGQPVAVHFHGSASLAPFDGWAEDKIYPGESKDYMYPNQRPTTAWYHDHAVHTTADNAYYGLAGMYLISARKKDGGCGAPFNLDDIPEIPFIMNDKLLNDQCQLTSDPDAHEDDLYGDINMVNGVPFPNMAIDPKTYRFRMLNAAVSRPFLVKIRDSNLRNIGHKICKVVGADGGYREKPVDLSTTGLLVGVAERWDLVCDFSDYQGQTLYFWNDKDSQQMDKVPYFCYSHLISRIQVSNTPSRNAPKMNSDASSDTVERPMSKVLSTRDINRALKMARDGKYHRRFSFGRSGGQWVINGETWESARVAASDVGHNTWEVWKFKTGGGWFHPIHVL